MFNALQFDNCVPKRHTHTSTLHNSYHSGRVYTGFHRHTRFKAETFQVINNRYSIISCKLIDN